MLNGTVFNVTVPLGEQPTALYFAEQQYCLQGMKMMVSVIPQNATEPETFNLSNGAIAGVVTVVVLFCIIVVLVIVVMHFKKKRKYAIHDTGDEDHY